MTFVLIMALLSVCATLIAAVIIAPEIAPPSVEDDKRRADAIIAAWLKPTNRVKAGV